jgi:hypothetical protein
MSNEKVKSAGDINFSRSEGTVQHASVNTSDKKANKDVKRKASAEKRADRRSKLAKLAPLVKSFQQPKKKSKGNKSDYDKSASAMDRAFDRIQKSLA